MGQGSWGVCSKYYIKKEDQYLHQRPEPLILGYAKFGSYRNRAKQKSYNSESLFSPELDFEKNKFKKIIVRYPYKDYFGKK